MTANPDPPEGFVATPGTIQADVPQNTLQGIEFTVKDVGSDWSHTKLTHHIKHNGKDITIVSETGMVNKQKK